jgi:hypothetical protein
MALEFARFSNLEYLYYIAISVPRTTMGIMGLEILSYSCCYLIIYT